MSKKNSFLKIALLVAATGSGITGCAQIAKTPLGNTLGKGLSTTGNMLRKTYDRAINQITPNEKEAIQRGLNDKSCTDDDGQPLVVDGDLGDATQQAFKKLQDKNPGIELTSESISDAQKGCKEQPTTNIPNEVIKGAPVNPTIKGLMLN